MEKGNLKSLEGKFTIYVDGAVGYQKIECRNIEFGLVEYAQYKDAVMVEFIPKGKRLRRVIEQGYKPKIVIIKGWNHPDAPSAGTEYDPDITGIVSITKFSISKEGFKKNDENFDLFFEKYTKENTVDIIVDFRNHNPISK